MIETKVMTITPEMAQEMLKSNSNNRPISKVQVSMLARDIAGGRFATTHQGIAFSEDGSLLDGQHRLLAIIKAGVPVTMLVTHGIDNNAAIAVDSGRKRSFKDNVEMLGAPDDNPLYSSKPVIAAVKQLAYFEIKRTISYYETLDLISGLMPWLQQLHSVVLTRKKKPLSTVNAAFLAALICGEPSIGLCSFAQVFLYGDISGCEDYNYNAALMWSNRFLREKAQKTILPKDKVFLGTQNAIWLFLNGFNTKGGIKIPTSSRYPVRTKLSLILDGGAIDA